MVQKFDRVLFIRVDAELDEKLNALLERLRSARPQNPLSKSALVRDLLWDGVRDESDAWDTWEKEGRGQ